jgi:hypothetical protein
VETLPTGFLSPCCRIGVDTDSPVSLSRTSYLWQMEFFFQTPDPSPSCQLLERWLIQSQCLRHLRPRNRVSSGVVFIPRLCIKVPVSVNPPQTVDAQLLDRRERSLTKANS